MKYAIFMSTIGATSVGPVLTPTVFEVNVQDLDSDKTTRTSSGKMVRYVTRGGDKAIRSIHFEWNNIDASQVKTLLDFAKERYVWIRYPDPLTANLRTAQFYIGDRKCTVKRVTDPVRGRAVYGSVSFNAIEV